MSQMTFLFFLSQWEDKNNDFIPIGSLIFGLQIGMNFCTWERYLGTQNDTGGDFALTSSTR